VSVPPGGLVAAPRRGHGHRREKDHLDELDELGPTPALVPFLDGTPDLLGDLRGQMLGRASHRVSMKRR
jgi:hypothetical protein